MVVQPDKRTEKMSLIQVLAWIYAVKFVFIASLSYIPGVVDAEGMTFGLFTLDIWDDLLHLGSGLWAAWAAWQGRASAVFYFKLFGVMYGLDGVLGLIFGQAYLDAGLLIYGPTYGSLLIRFLANLPHLLIGGIAVWIGFYLARRYQ